MLPGVQTNTSCALFCGTLMGAKEMLWLIESQRAGGCDMESRRAVRRCLALTRCTSESCEVFVLIFVKALSITFAMSSFFLAHFLSLVHLKQALSRLSSALCM